jgi:hypothetical protein
MVLQSTTDGYSLKSDIIPAARARRSTRWVRFWDFCGRPDGPSCPSVDVDDADCICFRAAAIREAWQAEKDAVEEREHPTPVCLA